MVLLGILCGVLAAMAHAIAFAISRRFIVQVHGTSLQLMVLSHALMGPMAAAVLLLTPLHGVEMTDVCRWLPATIGAGGTYLIGQALFFLSLRYVAASRLVPLLGLKVVAVAPISIVMLGAHFGWPQYAAIGLSLAAGAMLHHIGGRLPLSSLAITLFAVCLFAFSDVYIFKLIPLMGHGFAAIARSVCVVYGACGLAALPLLPWYGSRRASAWAAALPHAAIWFPSMFLLFACIALCGPVLGNIAIGTRGLLSIALGSAIAARGLFHLEQHASRGVVLRRLLAAGLMIGAMALYRLDDQWP
ncbi:MAG: EamA family transporter, partial [Planctomycetia bacterium]|nr:EamA family transporter [Planctomycetia bacterium]